VESKSTITSRGVVSFLQVTEAEAQAEIFYGPFYGLTKFCRKTAQLDVTPRKPVLPHPALKNTLCNTAKKCTTR
jgi:hypothetical protein